jgi:hypothetical protein
MVEKWVEQVIGDVKDVILYYMQIKPNVLNVIWIDMVIKHLDQVIGNVWVVDFRCMLPKQNVPNVI